MLENISKIRGARMRPLCIDHQICSPVHHISIYHPCLVDDGRPIASAAGIMLATFYVLPADTDACSTHNKGLSTGGRKVEYSMDKLAPGRKSTPVSPSLPTVLSHVVRGSGRRMMKGVGSALQQISGLWGTQDRLKLGPEPGY